MADATDNTDDSPSMWDQLKRKLAQASSGQPLSLSANGNTFQADPQAVQDAINTSSGAVGSIQAPTMAALSRLAGATEDAAPTLAKKLQQVAGNSTAGEAVEAPAQPVRNFFDKARQKATELGIGASPEEQAAMKAQGDANRAAIRARNLEQIKQANRLTPDQQQALSKLYNGGE